MDSSSFALTELDLSEEALLAPHQQRRWKLVTASLRGQWRTFPPSLAVPASSSSANPALQASFGPIGWPDGAGPSGISLSPAHPAAPPGRGGIVHVGAHDAPAGGRSRPRPRHGRALVARHNVSPQRPYYPRLLDNPLPVRDNYLLSLHPWSRYADLRSRHMVTCAHNRSHQ
ncbi:hypothetical protein V3C99_005605 [Haemonchus contortus]